MGHWIFLPFASGAVKAISTLANLWLKWETIVRLAHEIFVHKDQKFDRLEASHLHNSCFAKTLILGKPRGEVGIVAIVPVFSVRGFAYKMWGRQHDVTLFCSVHQTRPADGTILITPQPRRIGKVHGRSFYRSATHHPRIFDLRLVEGASISQVRDFGVL